MKKIFSLTFIIFMTLASIHAIAANEPTKSNASNAAASISGRVIDNKTGESLVGVVVCVEGTNLKVYTDLDGNFSIDNIQPGNYNLVLSLISYKNSLVENLKLTPNNKEVIDIKLDIIK